MDNLNLPTEVSNIQALVDTTTMAGTDVSLNLNATDTAKLNASTTSGAALSEANIQVFGSRNSATTAGADLGINTQANLNLVGSAISTSGSAEARSGAGAGAGVTTRGTTANDTGNVQPTSTSYGLVTGLANGNQTAGVDLTIQANAASTLSANASTVSGTDTLGSLWTSAGNILLTFDPAANTAISTPSLIGVQLLAELLLQAIQQMEGRGRTEGQHGVDGEGCGCGVVVRPLCADCRRDGSVPGRGEPYRSIRPSPQGFGAPKGAGGEPNKRG
jgi:hypothetical protein